MLKMIVVALVPKKITYIIIARNVLEMVGFYVDQFLMKRNLMDLAVIMLSGFTTMNGNVDERSLIFKCLLSKDIERGTANSTKRIYSRGHRYIFGNTS